MKGRNILGLMLFVMLLLPAVGSGLASGSQRRGSTEAAAASVGRAAIAPWLNIEVDTDNDTGHYASVAIEPSTGAPHISYYDAVTKDLRTTQYVGSAGNCGPNNSWLCQTVDSEDDVGKYSSIAINPVDGLVWIAYYDATNGNLKYAKASAPWNWQIRTVDTGVPANNKAGEYTSVKFNSTGKPYISYHYRDGNNYGELRIASWVGSGGNCGEGTDAGRWRCKKIQGGGGTGQYTSLALDGSGKWHVAYYKEDDGELWYATPGSGNNCDPSNNWSCIQVAGGSSTDEGKYASLYMDDDDHFHIAYYDATASALKYAADVDSGGNCGLSGSAQCDTIDSMPADEHVLGVSMAEDAAGFPIIAYQSQGGFLNVARPVVALGLSLDTDGNCGPQTPLHTWYCETINPHSHWVPYHNADYTSIAVNSSGLATIAYNGYIKSSGGNLDVSFQQPRTFLPMVTKDQ